MALAKTHQIIDRQGTSWAGVSSLGRLSPWAIWLESRLRLSLDR
jgi:hypothetical protein